jgi:hypothetical protein
VGFEAASTLVGRPRSWAARCCGLQFLRTRRDRYCPPVSTDSRPPIWHAGSTPSRTWATATGRCATSTRPSCAGRSGTAAGSRSAPRATRSSPPSPARWGRSGPRWTPSGLRCSLQPPMNDRCLDPHTVARFCRSGFRFQRGWVLAIRLEPVGRLVRHPRHVFRSGVAVAYCGRPVGR